MNRRDRRERNRRGYGGQRREWHRTTREQWHSDPRSGPSTSQTSQDGGSSTPSAAPSTEPPELRGFYFDADKNRYFRLLPGHNNYNPLTCEQLLERERERRRAVMLTKDDMPNKKAPRTGRNTALLMNQKHLGLLSGDAYCRAVHEVKVSGMRRHRLTVQSSDSSYPDTDNFRRIVGDSACERVFTVNDVPHGGCKYGIMTFKGCKRGSMSAEMCDNLYFTNRKVNSICWASVSHPDSHVLLCLVGIAETPGCVSLLPVSLFSNSNPDQPGMLCSFKISTAWSCAWCLNPQADKIFSTGLSRRVIVKDAETGRTQTYGVSSDVLAQQFALRAPVLFNGCRSGDIFNIDLRQGRRSKDSWKCCRFRQESAVTSISLLHDENYLLAADMLGQIKLWDVRVSKVVQEFKGHNNESAYLPVHVNESEGLLLAVGQDCYTRLWSLSDALLLRTIPSPHPAARDLIPSVQFSSQLGGRGGAPGLLMAVKHDLYYFPYNTDYQDAAPQPQST